jgi:hypothetical protein
MCNVARFLWPRSPVSVHSILVRLLQKHWNRELITILPTLTRHLYCTEIICKVRENIFSALNTPPLLTVCMSKYINYTYIKRVLHRYIVFSE